MWANVFTKGNNKIKNERSGVCLKKALFLFINMRKVAKNKHENSERPNRKVLSKPLGKIII